MFYAYRLINGVLHVTNLGGLTEGERQGIFDAGWTEYQTTTATAWDDAHRLSGGALGGEHLKVGALFSYLEENDSVIVGIAHRQYGTTVDLFILDMQTYVYGYGVWGTA